MTDTLPAREPQIERPMPWKGEAPEGMLRTTVTICVVFHPANIGVDALAERVLLALGDGEGWANSSLENGGFLWQAVQSHARNGTESYVRDDR